jgi:acyl transferase domain-containing protein
MGLADGIPEEIQEDLESSLKDTMLYYSGTSKALYSNRVSYVFDLKGPSMTIDTACSSSLVAFDTAVTDLRLGKFFIFVLIFVLISI